jgi:hypothetical protein
LAIRLQGFLFLDPKRGSDFFESSDFFSRAFQSTPEERLSIVGGKRPPQFYMPSYEAEIPESQKKDSDIISGKKVEAENTVFCI